jgi:hypothetical protein
MDRHSKVGQRQTASSNGSDAREDAETANRHTKTSYRIGW